MMTLRELIPNVNKILAALDLPPLPLTDEPAIFRAGFEYAQSVLARRHAESVRMGRPIEMSAPNRGRRSRAQIDQPLTAEDMAEARKLWGFKPKT